MFVIFLLTIFGQCGKHFGVP